MTYLSCFFPSEEILELEGSPSTDVRSNPALGFSNHLLSDRIKPCISTKSIPGSEKYRQIFKGLIQSILCVTTSQLGKLLKVKLEQSARTSDHKEPSTSLIKTQHQSFGESNETNSALIYSQILNRP
jgi:hypothetical protein